MKGVNSIILVIITVGGFIIGGECAISNQIFSSLK